MLVALITIYLLSEMSYRIAANVYALAMAGDSMIFQPGTKAQ